jgi:hypothetical protein
MPDLKLLRIESGDDQKSLIDKSNSNFSNTILFGGGPYGKVGQRGEQGDPGLAGPLGSYGDLGIRGTIWEVTDEYPGITGYFNGDFWLNTKIGSGLPVYQFNNSSWDSYGFNLVSQDLFRVYSPLPTSTGDSSYSGYHLSSINPDKYTLVISDNSIVGATASTNPQYSKFVISSDGSLSGSRPILEFAKVDSLSNSTLYSKNPRFTWVTTGANANYDLRFLSSDSFFVDIPTSDLSFSVTGNSGSGFIYRSLGFNMNLSGNRGLYVNTSAGRIVIDLMNNTPAAKAKMVINFNNWNSFGYSASNEGVSVTTPLGSLSFTVPSGTYYEEFGDEYINSQVIPILAASGFNTNYTFINAGGQGVAAVEIEANFAGSNYSFTTNTPTNTIVTGVTPGVTPITATDGYALFSNRNLTYLTDNFNLPVRFNFNSQSGDTSAPVTLISNKSYLGGFRHKTNVASSRNSTLFRVYNTSQLLVNLYASGDLFYNKRVTSVQAPQAPATASSTGNAYTGSSGGGGGTGTPVSVNWSCVVPTIVSPAATSSNRINASNGVDYLVSLSAISAQRGICLWTPSEGGVGLNDNGGWLQLLNPLESITLRVRTTDTNYFRFIGLGSGSAFTTAPLDVSASFQAIDLTNSSSLGVSDAEFTIVNLTNNTSSTRNSYVKWFIVYYSAWGGTLNAPRCGYMYAQIIQSSFINSGGIVMSTWSLNQTVPYSLALASGSSLTPSSPQYFTGYFFSATSLSSAVTFVSAPTTVTATLTLYPSGTVINGTITGAGTSRTVTWSSVNLSTSTAYRVSIGGV